MRQVPQKTIHLFKQKKAAGEPIAMITCYDYASAKIIAQTSIDCVLVGDSVAMVMHGHDSTIHADMNMMLLHTRAVARGLGGQFLVADLPFLEHRQGKAHTIRQAGELIRAGAQAIKVEGGDVECCAQIEALTTAGIPVMGHLGLTPQSIHALGGHRVQGKLTETAERIQKQALELEKAGCFALVLECVPEELAAKISKQLNIATIGIGAGAHTDGQVLVWHDVLGLQDTIAPRFIQKYLDSKPMMTNALDTYVQAINKRLFPAPEHCY